MNNIEENVGHAASGSADTVTPITQSRAGKNRPGEPRPRETRQSRLVRFIEELRRRRVCRALTMYAVALWLISQVVDLAYQALGLPDWTLRFVMVVGLVGLPIALLLAWVLDLTPQGLVLDSNPQETGAQQSKRPGRKGFDRRIDYALLLVAVVIAASLLYASVNPTEGAVAAHYNRVAVTPFRVGPGEGISQISESLTAELQYELASRGQYKVLAPRDPYGVQNCLTLTGSISSEEGQLRITVTLIDNESMAVVRWDVIQKDQTDVRMTVADIATMVVDVLEGPNDV